MVTIPVLLETDRSFVFGLLTERGLFKVCDLAHKWGDSKPRSDHENFKQIRPTYSVIAIGDDANDRIKEMGLWDGLLIKMATDLHEGILGPKKAAERRRSEMLVEKYGRFAYLFDKPTRSRKP